MKEDALSNLLDTDPFEPGTAVVVSDPTENLDTTLVVEPDQNPEDADFDYARKNQIDLIETSKQAVSVALKITNESEQARAVETLALMLKTASEMNRQLVIMSKDRAEVKIARSTTGGKPISGGKDSKGRIMSNLSEIRKMLAELETDDGFDE